MFTDKYSSDLLWVEKYRPKAIEDLALPIVIKQQITNLLKDIPKFPNLLFIGPAGTGKTTISRIICDTIIKDDMDLLILNGSEQRGIDVIRNYIIQFLSSQPIASTIKIVFIDEADFLSQDAWASLRHVIEKYIEYGRFILTANESKIPKPIQSRFVTFTFDTIPKDSMLKLSLEILANENIKMEVKVVAKIIAMLYPDFRKVINTLQKYANSPTENILELLDNDSKVITMIEEYIESVRNGSNPYTLLNELIKVITTSYLDYTNILKSLFYKLPIEYIPIKVLISQYINRFSNIAIPSMLFLEFTYRISEVVRDIQ